MKKRWFQGFYERKENHGKGKEGIQNKKKENAVWWGKVSSLRYKLKA